MAWTQLQAKDYIGAKETANRLIDDSSSVYSLRAYPLLSYTFYKAGEFKKLESTFEDFTSRYQKSLTELENFKNNPLKEKAPLVFKARMEIVKNLRESIESEISRLQRQNIEKFPVYGFLIEKMMSKHYFEANLIYWNSIIQSNGLEKIKVFKFNGEYEENIACPLPQRTKKSARVNNEFFGIDPYLWCLRKQIKNNVFQIVDLRNHLKLLGEAPLEFINNTNVDQMESKVYAVIEDDSPAAHVYGYGKVSFASAPAYVLAKGKYKDIESTVEREIGIQLSPSSILNMSGVMNGRLILNIDSGF
jgi:hypothetical protein